MFKVGHEVTVGGLRFRKPVSVVVESSYEDLTDTCELVLTQRVRYASGTVVRERLLSAGTNPLLRRGSEVLVRLGYDADLREVFRGVVRSLGSDSPAKLVCEDMLLLKAGSFTRSYARTTLRDLLLDVLGPLGIRYVVTADWDLGALRFSKQTAAQVLRLLRERYFVRAFWREGILYVGLAVVPEIQRSHVINFRKNLVSNNLEWQERDDLKIKLEGVILYRDNSRKEITIGDEDGEVRTFHCYEQSETDARRMMEAELERLRYTGYRGDLTIFGQPQVRHGDLVRLYDPARLERDTRPYIVKKVKTESGMGGVRQTLTF